MQRKLCERESKQVWGKSGGFKAAEQARWGELCRSPRQIERKRAGEQVAKAAQCGVWLENTLQFDGP